jgi:hypothetical protein
MPPAPAHSQVSAPAKAGIERAPPTSAAMSLSATVVIQAPPNTIISTASAVKATRQDCFVSTDDVDEGGILIPAKAFTLPLGPHL